MAVELGFEVTGVAGPDVGAIPDGGETGAGSAGDDVGVVEVGVEVGVGVGVGFVGDATGVGLRVVVPGMAGLDGGALPEGAETGEGAAGDDGDDVGVVEV